MNIMDVLEKQWKLIAGSFIGLVLVGAAVIFSSQMQMQKEQKAQESYFLTEKKYLELKNKKTAANADEKKQNKDSLVTSYEDVKKDFEKVISMYPASKASQMSALYLSEIYNSENNRVQALDVLKKNEGKDSGLVNSLLQQQLGVLLADQDKCQEAMQIWDKIINRKEASFLHNEIKIQQALCYKKMNDLAKAEEILTNLANQKPESNLETSATSKEAEKYLRLIQFKKASGT